MVHADVKPKRTQTVPTLVTNASKSNAEPTTIVQKPKNFVTMKLMNVTRLTVQHMTTAIKTMVTKNVKPTSASRLIASPMHIAAPWVSVSQTHVTLFNARPTVTVPLDPFVEIKTVSQ